MSTDPVVWTEPAGGSMSEVVSTFTHAVSAEVPEEVKEVAGHMTMDEVVALGIAVACLLSLAWTLLSAPVIRALRATCLKDLLLKIEIAAEMRAQQAAMEHASAATDAASKQVAAKQAKAANILKAIGSSGPPSPPKGKGAAAKKGGASPAPPPPPPSQPAPPAELRGSKYDLGKYAPELLTAERSAIEAAKAELDAKLKGASAQPTMAIDKSAPKKPRVGVRGHGKGARSRATLVYPGDGVYEGEYVDGLKDGVGKFFYVLGSVYEGQWRSDEKEGEGRETYADGAVYEGTFHTGARHGQGTLQYANSDSYEGEWDDDLKHGYGIFRWAVGTVYEGEFAEGVMHGRGTYFFADGCTYQGEYEDGKRHGRGVYRFLDGSVFEGEYNRGVVEGRGTFTFADGSQEVGRWEDGWPVGEATRFSPDHKKAWRLIDGHVQGPVSMDIADLIGRMAFRPKPWERAAQLARALRDKLSAMEFEQIRDLAMATIASNAKPEQANAGGLQKSDGKGAQNVKQQADAQGRLLPRAGGGAPSSPGKSPGKASSGAEGAEGGSAAKGGGGGADTDAYTAHMARVHGDRKKSPKKKRGQQSKGREGAGSPTKEGAPPDLEAGGAGGAGPLEV